MDVTILGVVCTPKEVGEALRQVQEELALHTWVRRQKLVLGTRIPVLKIESHAGVPVDVTISDSPQHTGLLARDLVLSYLQEAPQLAPLVLVLKAFLRERGLNDPYTGGMSSYSLVVLLWNFCVESHQRGFNVHDVGCMLVGFFQHFLYRFEAQVAHVDDPLGMRYNEADGSMVCDNIMHSCYQIGRVCRSFRQALAVLNSKEAPWETAEGPFLPRLFKEVGGSEEGPINAVTQTDDHFRSDVPMLDAVAHADGIAIQRAVRMGPRLVSSVRAAGEPELGISRLRPDCSASSMEQSGVDAASEVAATAVHPLVTSGYLLNASCILIRTLVAISAFSPFTCDHSLTAGISIDQYLKLMALSSNGSVI